MSNNEDTAMSDVAMIKLQLCVEMCLNGSLRLVTSRETAISAAAHDLVSSGLASWSVITDAPQTLQPHNFEPVLPSVRTLIPTDRGLAWVSELASTPYPEKEWKIPRY